MTQSQTVLKLEELRGSGKVSQASINESLSALPLVCAFAKRNSLYVVSLHHEKTTLDYCCAGDNGMVIFQQATSRLGIPVPDKDVYNSWYVGGNFKEGNPTDEFRGVIEDCLNFAETALDVCLAVRS